MADDHDKEEERVIRHKLLLKESSLKRATKKYISLFHAIESGTYEDCFSIYQGLLKELETYQFGIQKAIVLSQTNEREMDKYNQIYIQREEEIKKVQEEIALLKEELARERIERAHKEQYAQLAKIISEKPSTSETEREIEALNKELDSLTQDSVKVSQKLDLRSKQFQLLLHSLVELQRELDAEVVEPPSTPSEDVDMAEVTATT